MQSGRRLFADHRLVMSPNFNDVTKTVRKRRQQLHAREVRGLVAFCFHQLEDKIAKNSCFPSNFKMQTMFTPIS